MVAKEMREQSILNFRQFTRKIKYISQKNSNIVQFNRWNGYTETYK